MANATADLGQVEAPTEAERHDWRYWDRVAGYREQVCDGCDRIVICQNGFCQECWLGEDIVDDVQRALDDALRALRKADDLLGQVTSPDRMKEIHGQACNVLATASNYRLEVMKRCRRR